MPLQGELIDQPYDCVLVGCIVSDRFLPKHPYAFRGAFLRAILGPTRSHGLCRHVQPLRPFVAIVRSVGYGPASAAGQGPFRTALERHCASYSRTERLRQTEAQANPALICLLRQIQRGRLGRPGMKISAGRRHGRVAKRGLHQMDGGTAVQGVARMGVPQPVR